METTIAYHDRKITFGTLRMRDELYAEIVEAYIAKHDDDQTIAGWYARKRYADLLASVRSVEGDALSFLPPRSATEIEVVAAYQAFLDSEDFYDAWKVAMQSVAAPTSATVETKPSVEKKG